MANDWALGLAFLGLVEHVQMDHLKINDHADSWDDWVIHCPFLTRASLMSAPPTSTTIPPEISSRWHKRRSDHVT